MTREQIIEGVKKHFSIKELVCNHVYNRFKEQSWMFLSTPLLHTILVLRDEILRQPMYVNTSNLKQRGLRCNLCPLVKNKTKVYLSAHCTGNGIDFTCSNMTADAIRRCIKDNQDKLPYNVRLEDGVNWCHIDVYDTGNKITIFKA